MSDRPAYRALARTFSIVLPLLGILALLGTMFAHNYVKDQLSQEQITMPSEKQIANLSDTDKNALKPFLDQKMENGPQAQAYANNYICAHMKSACKSIKASNGVEMTVPDDKCTYAGIGDVATEKKAELKGKGMSDADINKSPEITALNAARDSNFKGSALRSMLLTAFAFWLVGEIAKWAGIAMIIGGLLLGLLGWFLLKDKVHHNDAVVTDRVATDRPVAPVADKVVDRNVTTTTKPVDVDVDDRAVNTGGVVKDVVTDRTVTNTTTHTDKI